MRTNTLFQILTFLVCCIPSFTKAQTSDNKVLTGVSVTFMDYKGMVNKQFFNPRNFNPGVRINANMYMNGWLNYTLGASFVPKASYPQVDGTFNPQLLIDVNTGFQLKSNNGKIMDENAVFAPYIYSGLGYSTSEGKSGVYMPAALGIRFRLGNNVSLNMESMYRLKFSSTIQPMSHTIGFNFILPSQKPPVEVASRGTTKPKPVPTKPAPVITTKPQKPQENTPPAVAATTTTPPEEPTTEPKDEELVPVGKMKEEVAAEEVAATETEMPIEKKADDQDGDGVEDRFDACPYLAGPIAEGGCPERERVAVAKEEATLTSPDTDGDGVEDAFDPCPNIPGRKEKGGCPDRYEIGKAAEENSANKTAPIALGVKPLLEDKKEDIVETEPTEIVDNGAASREAEELPAKDEVAATSVEEVAENPGEQGVDDVTAPQTDQQEEALQAIDIYDMSRLKIIAMNMNYKPGTDALMPDTEAYIQELKDLLSKYPKYKLVIHAHYSGGLEEDDNKIMSVKRAFQIKRQLILGKGMPPVRMNPDGYGSEGTSTKNESRIELELVPMK